MFVCKTKRYDMNYRNKILTPKEVSQYIGIGIHTLALYRIYGNGPKYLKLGRVVRYKLGDILDWIDRESEQNRHA